MVITLRPWFCCFDTGCPISKIEGKKTYISFIKKEDRDKFIKEANDIISYNSSGRATVVNRPPKGGKIIPYEPAKDQDWACEVDDFIDTVICKRN
jgi:hypothetical protein